MKLTKKHLLISLSVTAAVLLWWLLAVIVNSKLILPSPWQTVAALPQIFASKSFFRKVGATLLRTIIGFLISFVLGSVLALLSMKKNVELILRPYITLLRSLPTLVITVLLTIWFSKNNAPVIIGFMMVFPVMYGGLLTALKNVDKNLVEMAKIYKVPGRDIIFGIYGRAALPYVFSTASNCFGMNFKVVVSAEVLIVPLFSIGREVFYSQQNLLIPEVFAWVVLVLLITFLVEKLFTIIEKAVIKWK